MFDNCGLGLWRLSASGTSKLELKMSWKPELTNWELQTFCLIDLFQKSLLTLLYLGKIASL